MDVASFSVVVAAISVVVGVVFAVLQMRDVVRTRHLGLIIQLNPSLTISPSRIQEAWSKMWNIE